METLHQGRRQNKDQARYSLMVWFWVISCIANREMTICKVLSVIPGFELVGSFTNPKRQFLTPKAPPAMLHMTPLSHEPLEGWEVRNHSTKLLDCIKSS